MTYEEYYKSLIADLNNRFPQLVKKYDLSVSHSGGGCFHIEMSLGEDVEYDIPKSNTSQCIFGIYKDGINEEEHKTFIKPFEEGLKMLNKRKEKKDE